MKRLHALVSWIAPALAALVLFAGPGAAPAAAQDGDPIVILETSKGRIAIRLAPRFAPRTVQNFLSLVDEGFYDGLTFHRVESWVVQGGCPHGDGSGKYEDPATGQIRYLPLETHPMLRHNSPGIVAMARSQNPNSASCQFYILKRPMPQLDGKYGVFGKVVQGMQSVYAIRPGDVIQRAYIWEPEPHSGGPPQQSGPGPGGSPVAPGGDTGF